MSVRRSCAVPTAQRTERATNNERKFCHSPFFPRCDRTFQARSCSKIYILFKRSKETGLHIVRYTLSSVSLQSFISYLNFPSWSLWKVTHLTNFRSLTRKATPKWRSLCTPLELSRVLNFLQAVAHLINLLKTFHCTYYF